ncbi:unnamed protein product [Aureobasidium uvarum]|uniref:Uncharacterized protein n=1 Tax=Aureobasidium uvarum TaxID=2773716 RepID=A0A9N8KCE8_9PEZI|nr:unnamed protein product [Aureobasidium uvarum]
MSESTPQQKANLARIRSCEAVGAEASQEIQSAARKVLEENKRLRRLLRHQGFSDADIDGPEHDEFASSPLAAEMLEVMLVTRKPCRPSSGSICGDSQMCKTEDEDDMESRRHSVISTPAAPVCAPSKPQQKQLRPIALAPAPVSALASASAPAPAVAPASRPRSHEPSGPNQQLPQHQHFQQQGEQHMQFPNHPQHHHLQPQQQQQFFMSPPQHASAPLAPHQNVHTSPDAFANDYPIYAPQPFGYSVPQSQLLDWDMAAAEPIPHSGTYTSPQAAFPTPGTYASPTHSNTAVYNQQGNTSSCFAAAGAIRALHSEAGDEVESALGCRADGNECRVDNAMVFDLMDRYSGVQGQQGSI